MLLEASQLPDGAVRERLKSDLQDLGGLVNELLRFAQAEDVMAREPQDLDVAEIARKVVEDSVGEAIEKQQSIELHCAGRAAVVSGNAALIEIAIRNLVGNAIKYSPVRSIVSVGVDAGSVVTVDDRGPGVAPEHRDRIFERFWRADGRSSLGAGVGLALVQRIAQLHDGVVRMEARAGGGTRMILDLGGSAARRGARVRASQRRERAIPSAIAAG
jgi:signal transduction histidine kinase